MHNIGVSLRKEVFYPLIPLLSPALKANSCEIDRELRESRFILITGVVSTLFFATLFLPVNSGLMLTIFPLCVLTALFSTPLVLILDYQLTERAADVRAVAQYLKCPFPPQEATRRIQGRLTAAQLLVEEANEENNLSLILNKCNAFGDRLMDYWSDYNNFDAFKFLINNGFDLKQLDRNGKSYFYRLLMLENPRYFAYVLESKILSVQIFTLDAQVEFWMNVPSEEAGKLLRQYDFHPDCQNNDGQTALFKLANSSSQSYFCRTMFPAARAAMLLSLGADPHKQISIKGELKTPLDVVQDLQIKNLMLAMSLQNSSL